ncbi:GMC oxidoreductase [Phanerochaete sordida]|uniref:GMC oxidoreductase n=1 Tax=Phanerochaete sordida TaxID=48140 RepID=A0A9P3GEZ4_9APHY|nr:GMC oxidoreductase [Phanerochaete sordida]
MSSTSHIDAVSGKSFDYIIIGGGNCGLTLAARLTEDPSKSVLVLESGGANLDDAALLRSASYGALHGNPQYDWGHKTTPQKHLDGRSVVWARGKGLGGSSGINFLLWTKPPAHDINDWEKLGNAGWNWESHQELLERTERWHSPSAGVLEKMRIDASAYKMGTKGALDLSFPPLFQDDEVRCLEALENAGIRQASNPFGGDPSGWLWCPNTYDPSTNTRSYAANAFYLPNKDRKNLFVLTDAHVHRVLTEPGTNGNLTATGVEFRHDGNTHTARAAKEVIVSAGALKSPQVLELSGIGRKDVLDKIGVSVKLELPGVGENVQEHVAAGIAWELKDDCAWQTPDLLKDPETFAKHLELLKEGKGIFTLGIVLMSFFPLDMISDKAGEIYQRAKEEIANIDPSTAPAGSLEQLQLQLQRFDPAKSSPTCEVVIVPGFWSGPNPPNPGKRYVTPMALLNASLSRGTIHATSNDPDEDPAFDPHYFERNADVEAFLETIKFMRNLVKLSPLKDIIAREINPGPEVETDEQLIKWAKAYFFTPHHTVGSLSMLPREKNGVVDPKLKVYGTNNLRVVDVSIVPLHISSHTQSTAYWIAEQAAEFIKESA